MPRIRTCAPIWKTKERRDDERIENERDGERQRGGSEAAP